MPSFNAPTVGALTLSAAPKGDKYQIVSEPAYRLSKSCKNGHLLACKKIQTRHDVRLAKMGSVIFTTLSQPPIYQNRKPSSCNTVVMTLIMQADLFLHENDKY